MSLTEIDIHHAAETLLAEGVPLPRISSRALRERLGRGSLGTIVPALRRWKEGRNAAAPAVTDAVPPDVAETFTRILQGIGPQLWGACQAWQAGVINTRLAALSEDLGVQGAELEAEIQRVEGVNVERGDTIERLSLELAQVREENARLERELATQTERTAAAEKNEADFREERDELRKRIADLEARNGTFSTRVQVLEAEIESKNRQIAKLNEEHATAQAALSEERTARQDERRKFEEELATVRAGGDEIRASAENATREAATSHARLEQAQSRVGELREELAHVRSEEQRLREEAAELRGQLAGRGESPAKALRNAGPQS